MNDSVHGVRHFAGNENALKAAESYANRLHMSKAGVYDQLVSEYGEQFTSDEAQYAIDHLND